MSISIHDATSLRGLKISSCGGLRSMDLQSLPGCYTPLEVLSLRSCKSLESISSLHGCTSLCELTIEDCDGLKTCALSGLESCTSIRALGVHDFQQLRQYAADGLGISLIEELTIYKSPKLISISNHGLRTLRKLVLIASYALELSIGNSTTVEELYLQDCTSLGSLCIDNCEKLRHVSVDGLEALIVVEELTMRNCPSLTFIPITLCLRGLVIEGCEQLSSLLSVLKHCNTLERMKISGSRNLVCIPISNVFPPSLGQFVIEDCAQLSSLQGRHESLRELSIVNCPELRWIFVADEGSGLTALRRLVIASCGGPKIHIDSTGTLEEISLRDCTSLGELRIENCQNLRHLVRDGWGIPPLSLKLVWIKRCSNLEALPSLDNLASLGDLRIVGCDALTGLPSGLSSCTSLRRLEIDTCQNLISLADVDVSSLRSLSKLTIWYCGKLQYLPTGLHTLTRLKELIIGGFWEELDSFPVSQIPSSTSLAVGGWPKLKSLPQVINHSTSSVTELTICNCDGLETVPEWLGDHTSLYHLEIYKCKNIKSLPSARAMQRLTKFKQLWIIRCPILKEACARSSGSEWPKISHIPKIKFAYDEEED